MGRCCVYTGKANIKKKSDIIEERKLKELSKGWAQQTIKDGEREAPAKEVIG